MEYQTVRTNFVASLDIRVPATWDDAKIAAYLSDREIARGGQLAGHLTIEAIFIGECSAADIHRPASIEAPNDLGKDAYGRRILRRETIKTASRESVVLSIIELPASLKRRYVIEAAGIGASKAETLEAANRKFEESARRWAKADRLPEYTYRMQEAAKRDAALR